MGCSHLPQLHGLEPFAVLSRFSMPKNFLEFCTGGERVRLFSRPGNDLTGRFPLIVETLARLRARSCIIDGEAVACDDNGVASFDLVRHQRANGSVFLYAFDLIELNGDDLRRDPLEVRKATLRSALAKAGLGLRFNEHLEGDGPTVFAHDPRPCCRETYTSKICHSTPEGSITQATSPHISCFGSTVLTP